MSWRHSIPADRRQDHAQEAPDTICREPKVAGRVLDDFNSMGLARRRRAIDIDNLVTIANNGENYISCHGVWTSRTIGGSKEP